MEVFKALLFLVFLSSTLCMVSSEGVDPYKIKELVSSRGQNPTHVCWKDDCYPDRPKSLGDSNDDHDGGCEPCHKGRPSVTINNNCGSTTSAPILTPTCPPDRFLCAGTRGTTCCLNMIGVFCCDGMCSGQECVLA